MGEGGGSAVYFSGSNGPTIACGGLGSLRWVDWVDWVDSVCDLEGRDRIVEQCWWWVFCSSLGNDIDRGPDDDDAGCCTK